jgi:regulator of protease activity HflC (stomatin/prohibitin superfamily)
MQLQQPFSALLSQVAIGEAIGTFVAVVIMAIILTSVLRIVREYERAVVFHLGRLIGAKGPGLIFLIPIVDKAVKVDLP